MKNFIKKIGAGAAVMLLSATSLAGSAWAWGPERATFTLAKPADYITFNSITDNKKNGKGVGDERNFVRVREAGTTNNWDDAIDVEPGKTYEVYIYYHNNASSNLNLVAENTRVFSYFPGLIAGEGSAEVGAKISANNAKPQAVWDEATFRNTKDVGVTLKYVANSATLHNADESGLHGSAALPTDLFKAGGTLIGYDALDGKLPGCAEYSGYITYNVEVTQAQVELEKTVSRDGKTYDHNTTARVGDTLYYKVTAKNTGSKDITAVTASDELTRGLVSLENPTLLDTATGGKNIKQPLTENFYKATGQSVYPLAKGGAGWTIVYTAKVTADALDGVECGEGIKNKAAKLINSVYIDYQTEDGGYGTLGNQAAVLVSEPCVESATEMPKTGVDGGEMLMTVLTVMSATGGMVYVICGVKMMKRREEMSVWQQQQGDDWSQEI